MGEDLFLVAEQLFSCLFISWGLSFIVQAGLWVRLVKWLYSLEEQTFKLVCLVSGALSMPFGLFLIFTHNQWDRSSAVIVTLMGWFILIKCLFLLLYPQVALKAKVIYARDELFLKRYLRGSGILYILMGLLVVYHFCG